MNNAEVDLRSIAQRAMLDRGFLIQFPAEAQTQSRVESEPAFETLKLPDPTSWMWSSIDNDDSRDLDQIEYAKKEKRKPGSIGVADVDWFVPMNSVRSGPRCATQHQINKGWTGDIARVDPYVTDPLKEIYRLRDHVPASKGRESLLSRRYGRGTVAT